MAPRDGTLADTSHLWQNRLLTSRGRVTVARQAHNLKIVGAIPAPATRTVRLSKNALFPLIKEYVVLPNFNQIDDQWLGPMTSET